LQRDDDVGIRCAR